MQKNIPCDYNIYTIKLLLLMHFFKSRILLLQLVKGEANAVTNVTSKILVFSN